jgi:sugar phosphate isomerase/epimerase
MYSRRDLGKLALAAVPGAAGGAERIDSVVHGIRFGLQSYVFTGLGLPPGEILDRVIASMTESGLGECDLFGPLVEPAALRDRIRSAPVGSAAGIQAREELAGWHMTVPLDYFRRIRKKFEDAGIAIPALSFFPGSTEAELSRTFEVADVVGAKLITLNIPISAAKRVAPVAGKSAFAIGIVGGPNMGSTNPDAIARPEQYEQAVSFSKNYGISFDIGDATGGGYDALKFVADHLDRIALLYIKDRRKTGESVLFGEGDAPIRQVLRLLRDRKYPIPCYLDCDYRTSNRAADVKRSFEYVKTALE